MMSRWSIMETPKEQPGRRKESQVYRKDRERTLDTDMHITISKTKSLHVRTQDLKIRSQKLQPRKPSPHWLHLYHCFVTKRELLIHKTKYKWKDEYEVEKLSITRVRSQEESTWSAGNIIHMSGTPGYLDPTRILKRSKTTRWRRDTTLMTDPTVRPTTYHHVCRWEGCVFTSPNRTSWTRKSPKTSKTNLLMRPYANRNWKNNRNNVQPSCVKKKNWRTFTSSHILDRSSRRTPSKYMM